MNSRLGRIGTFLILITLSVLVFCYFASQKEVWYADEIYTYESANGIESAWPHTTPDKWISGKDVESYLAADNSAFGFDTISNVLYGDHVPLYFWIFRFVSVLFFRGSASIWIGLSINLFFFLLAIISCFFFLHKHIGDIPSAILIFLVMVVSVVGANQYTVLRMYMMMLALELLLMILSFKVISGEKWSGKSWGQVVCLYLVSLCGLMTHYDFWIFYAFTSAFGCLYLVIKAFGMRKEMGAKMFLSYPAKAVYAWCVSFAAALITLDRLFPYWKWNLHKDKGEKAISALFAITRERLDNIGWGFERLSALLFGEKVPAVPVVIIFYGVIAVGIGILCKKKRIEEVRCIVLAMVIAVSYRIVVCYTLPDVREERYLWCSITIEALCLGYLVISMLQMIAAKKIGYAIGCVLCVGILANNIMNFDKGLNVSYLFQPNRDVSKLEAYSDVPWVVYGPLCGMFSYYDWTMPTELCFITEEKTDSDDEAARHLAGKDVYLLYVHEALVDDAVEYFNLINGTDCHAEYLTQSTNLTVYVVR